MTAQSSSPSLTITKCLTLKLKNSTHKEFCFHVTLNTQMKEIMSAYAEKKSVDISSLRFVYNGIRLCEQETPKSLAIKDNDILYVGDQEKLTIVFFDEKDNPIGSFLIEYQKTFKVIKKLLTVEEEGKKKEKTFFVFEGRHLKDTDTPYSVGMEVHSRVEVHPMTQFYV